jgi:hypothetical protein
MINGEYKPMGEGRNSHTPTTALGGLTNSNANIILIKLFAKCYTVKV